MSLADFLHQGGYQQIPLTRSGVGHFHTEGRLNEHAVFVLVDTGAASTVVSVTRARALGLTLSKLPFQGGGAGAARLEIHQISNAVLRLGDLALRVQLLIAMDLGHVNEALRLKGELPWT
jgi:clan AA aspartic protease (TIGR02281 family)